MKKKLISQDFLVENTKRNNKIPHSISDMSEMKQILLSEDEKLTETKADRKKYLFNAM